MSEPMQQPEETTATAEGTIHGQKFKRTLKVEGNKVSEPNQGELRAESFATAYGEAFNLALKAKQLTDTPAWQDLYAAHKKIVANARVKLKTELERLAVVAGETGLGENDVKDLKTAGKLAEALRDGISFFDSQTVSPVRSTAERCQYIIDQAKTETVVLPLLAGDIEAAIAKVKAVKWEQTTGRILI